MSLYRLDDKAALEIAFPNSTLNVHDLTRLAREAREIGFRRVSVYLSEQHRADVRHEINSITNDVIPLVVPWQMKDCKRGFNPKTGVVYAVSDKDVDRFNELYIDSHQDSFITLLVDISEDATSNEFYRLVKLLSKYQVYWNFQDVDPWQLNEMLPRLFGEIKVWDELRGTALLRKHPCFTYLCKSEFAHCRSRFPPRRIRITEDGDVIPYGLDLPFSLGNLRGHSLREMLEDCYQSSGGKEFLNAAKDVVATYVLTDFIQFLSIDGALRKVTRG